MSAANSSTASSTAKSNVQFDVNSLLDDILKNPDKPVELTREQIVEAQKRINLYGVVVPATTAYANFSIINNREHYMRKLCTTALVSYLYRAAMEYVARDDVLEVPPELCKAFGIDAATPEQSAAYRAAAGKSINHFLQYNFNFDPDRHVRSAYKDNLGDPERAGKFDQYKAAMSTAPPRPVSKVLESIKSKLTPEEYAAITNELYDQQACAFTTCVQGSKRLIGAMNSLESFTKCNPFADLLIAKDLHDRLSALSSLTPVEQTMFDMLKQYFGVSSEELLDAVDLRSILARDAAELREIADKLYPNIRHNVSGAYHWVPPVDVFHHFDRYLTNHFELLRECTQILYGEKPDIDFAVQFYDKSFDTREEAEQSLAKIRDRVTTAVYTISNEGWFLLGPFKQNRERIEFYNKNTEILKRMMEQAESDSKLGEDLLRKRVKRGKQQNILQAGPDDPGLAKYQEALGVIDNLGSKTVLTNEEKAKLAEAVSRKEMTEVPPDAIQVDIHKPVEQPDGTVVMQRDKFYTQAEAPTFMQENLRKQTAASESLGKGAPVEAYSNMVVGTTNHTKQLKSRDGEIRTLADLRNNVLPASHNQ